MKRVILLLMLVLAIGSITYAQLGTASVTYSSGDIGTDKYFWATYHNSTCPGLMTVSIPANSLILSTDVSYDFTSLAGSGVYRQRSQLRCVTAGGTSEPEIARGASVYVPGTESYSRTGLDIANGITVGGDIEFELHAGLTHYQHVCNTDLGIIDNNSWTITIHYIPPGYPMQASNPIPSDEAIYIELDDDLTWDFGADTDTYDLYFGTDNPPTTLVVDNAAAGATGTYDPGAMNATETYYWQVDSRNTNGYTSGQVWSFTTICGPYSTPFTEDFEDATPPDLPYCWTSIVNSSSPSAKVATESGAGNNEPKSLRMTNSNDANATLLFISPEIEVGDGSLADKMINFHAGYNSGYPSLAIGTMSDPADETTFTEYDSFYVTAEYGEHNEYDIYFDDYTGTDKHIAFKLDVSAAYQGASLDDITISDLPTCIRPEDLFADNLTINSATLNWTDLNGATSWNIEYGLAGFTPTGTPTVSGVSNPYELTGLTSATDYDFYVQTDCGGADVSTWSQIGTFSTPCDYFAVPFSENFDAVGFGEMPGCWSSILLTTDGYASNGVTSNYNAHSAPNDFQMMNGNDPNATLMLISPPIADISLNRIRFFARSNIAGHNLIIGTMSNPADQNTFDSLTSVTITAANINEEFDVWFNNYNGTDSYFVIKHSSAVTGLKFNIDDVSIEELPSCLPPVDLFVDNITNVSADFNWTESGTATDWEIEVGALGYDPGTGAQISQYFYNNPDPINLSYELAGLSSATVYDVYIRTDCGGDDLSPWTGPLTFLSGFDAFGELPITEDFEEGMGITDNNYLNVQDWVINTNLHHSGTNSIYNPYNNNGDNVLFITGTIDLTANADAMLTFWQIAKTDGRSDNCYVEISTDGGLNYDQLPESTYMGSGRYREDDLYAPFEGPCFDEDSYTDWGTANTTPDNTWWKKEYFNLSDFNSFDNVIIRFRLVSNAYTNRNGWYIDDIAIEASGTPDFYVDPFAITLPLDPSAPIVNLDMIMGNAGNFPASYTAHVVFDEVELLNANFNSGIPANWEIVNNGTNDVTWTDTSSIYNRNIDGTPMAWVDGIQGNLQPPDNIMDEELITPAMDASPYGEFTLQLEYDQIFDADYQPGDTAKVYVFDGSDWVMIYESWTDDGSPYSGGTHKIWDVSAYANDNFKVKFRYIEGSITRRGRYWAIDNVKIRASMSAIDWLSLDGGVAVSGVALPDGDGSVSRTIVQLDGTNLGNGTYTAEIEVVSTDTANAVIIVPVMYWSPLSSAEALAFPDEVCSGSNTQLYVNLIGGTGNQVYSWTSIPAGFTSNLVDPIASPTETTTYYVEVIDNGTVVNGEVTVSVNPLPDVSIETFNDMCVDEDEFVLTGGWPVGGEYSGTGVSNGVFYPSLAGAGTHIITYTYTNDLGCENFATTTITIIPLPVLTLPAFDDVCLNQDEFELTGGLPAGGEYSGTGVNNGVFYPVWAGLGTHVITYTYVTEFGCLNTADTTISVFPAPTVTIGAFDDVCIDENAFELTGGSPASGVYSGTGVVDGMFYPSAAGVGTFSISYLYSNVYGCSDRDHSEIIVNDLPIVTLSDEIACIQWSAFELTGGIPEGGYYSGQGVNNGMFDPQEAGIGEHTITYTYSDDNGCENYAEGTMLVDACTSVEELINELAMVVAPNPNSGLFSVSVSTELTEKVDLRVFNNLGLVVFEEKAISLNNNYSVDIDLSNQPKGMYFVFIVTKDNKFTKKVIVR